LVSKVEFGLFILEYIFFCNSYKYHESKTKRDKQKFEVAVTRGLKLGKKVHAEKRKMCWTSILTELPQKMR